MGECDFIEQAREQFRYLVDDFAFRVGAERYDPDSFGNALVEYESAAADVRITLDRGQVLIDVKQHSESWSTSFGLPTILSYLAPNVDEPPYVFPDAGDYCERVSWQLARLARVFRQFCGPILTGEFSDWDTMLRLRREQSEDEYRRLTGKARVRIESPDFWEKRRRWLDKRAREGKQ